MPRAGVIVLGGSGFVGSRALDLWRQRFALNAPSHADLDVLDPAALTAFLEANPGQTVVNLAAWADVDGAEAEQGRTDGRVYAVNVDYPRRLAETCARLGKHLVHVSTDYVFSGDSLERPYSEDDPTGPVCWYAETKLLGEQAVLAADAAACIARIEIPFSGNPSFKRDLARTVVARLQAGQTVQGVTDQHITPVFLDDAVEALGLLVDTRYAGIMHVASTDWTTPFRFARSIATRLGLDEHLVRPETFERFAATRAARRPRYSWLDVSRFQRRFGSGILRTVEDELDAWAEQMRVAGLAERAAAHPPGASG
ncbi:MAG TPA: sugar nucleotide-binding protein [Chloroflexota bacterium]